MDSILFFKADRSLLENNLIELANTIRTLIYTEHESLFDLIDINDDRVFLEPSLFYYFYPKPSGVSTPILQSLWGYIPGEKKPRSIEVVTDGNGIINLPNYGYYKYLPNKTVNLIWSNGAVSFQDDADIVALTKIPEITIENSSLRLCQHEVDLLTKAANTTNFVEPIPVTVDHFLPTINHAWKLMRELVPDFCKLIECTTREISLFNSDNQFSKAALSYFGTAFINIQGQAHDEVFFIDDFAHQCGHVLFYTLSAPQSDFLKPYYRTPIQEFTKVDWEKRDIYGGFHGLFTYTTILHCLDSFLEAGIFSGKQKNELIGRLAFYMDKFRKDLSTMDDPRILTDKGYEYYDMFNEGYKFLYSKYKKQLRTIDFCNQTYLFNYALYNELNGNVPG